MKFTSFEISSKLVQLVKQSADTFGLSPSEMVEEIVNVTDPEVEDIRKDKLCIHVTPIMRDRLNYISSMAIDDTEIAQKVNRTRVLELIVSRYYKLRGL